MKKVLTILLSVSALGAGALLGYHLSSRADSTTEPAAQAAAAASAAPAATTAAAPAAAIAITVYKSPTCGCCGDWVKHLEQNGFAVAVHDVDDVDPFKRKAGLTPQLASCHTAFVDGYAVEGHVPAADIKRLLAERPAARGLTVPGMPLGSPGMEVEGRSDDYQVLLFRDGGDTRVFNEYLSAR